MITFPVLTFLRVENYGLFPGKPVSKGIEWDFKKGLCLIAGINGLGKTTLLTMLLRVFSGPFDLTGDGLPETLESVIPESPILLKTRVLRYFAQRVADQGREATVTLKAKFGKDEITISRHLFDLRLLLFAVNDEPRDLGANRQDREAAFQQLMCTFFDLSSFVDVLLVLHHVIFFMEVGLGALWDENAQRHLLRALYLEKDLAAQVAAAERRVVSTDSRARNISASAFAIEERLRHARASAANASEIAVELAAEQKLLDAELMERERLDSLLDELDEQRKEVRREYEQAKLTREEADQRFRAAQAEILFRRFAFPPYIYTHNASTFSETSYHRLTIDEKNLIVEVAAQLSFPSDSSTNAGFELKYAVRERRKGLEWQPDPSTTGAEAAKKFIVQLVQELTRSE
jgi:hypothetical protein